MDADLLLPVASCPGILDGWCGPVVVETVTGWREAAVVGDYIVLVTDRGRAFVEVAGAAVEPYIYIDLSRAECRDRVARLMAIRFDLPPGVAWLTLRAGRREDRWPVYGKRDDGGIVIGCRPEVIPTHAVLSTRPDTGRTSIVLGGWQVPYKTRDFFEAVVPALADLDPNDDTRLPDGSRRVDALALRAVAMEVGHG